MNNFPLQLRKYFSDQYRKVLIHVTDALDNPSYDSIHDLRVDLKRVRFIERIFNQYDVSKPKRCFEPYTKLFRYAGRIREIQVHTSLLMKYSAEFSQYNSLNKKLLKTNKKLIKDWSWVAISSLEKIIHSYPKIIRKLKDCRIEAAPYLVDLKEHLVWSFRKKPPDNQLHERRKILKGVLYTGELSPKYKSVISHFCNLKVASSLEDAIGDWHDLEVFLRQYQRINKGPGFKNLVKQKNLQRKKINKLLPHLIKTTKSYSTR